ncbi:family 78 glycoside hydrolase catalytic domain [Mucilaginibacter sp. UR6-11]|uniref:family 78 glycoside hydrolase catalytic domain n=1 Tax=Mucilaginibacter sp. UR6-11 TaxID=1435644 RepID=UPI001E504619|nr:family 78 glycoside hydrolase catalytic domain [Mucilaginibacter sp. UR6-11]MCC8423603.1 glycoside hydrolase family 78 protein [Mucilaginibacter sp. UR6-11]
MMKLKLTVLVLWAWYCLPGKAQDLRINPALLKGYWSASWISCPGAPQREYGIYHFRKNYRLDKVPSTFLVHVSADNRYRLFVNGRPVCSGPARGDLFNWYFETVDIAPFLQKGNNLIAALVWNMGELAPVAQISNQTGFVLQVDSPKHAELNSDSTWKVFQDSAYRPTSLNNGAWLQAYYAAGVGDRIDGRLYPWDWEQPAFDDARWPRATEVCRAVVTGYGTGNRWTLAPRDIPVFSETLTRFAAIRRSSADSVPRAFLQGTHTVTIPANRTVKILLDRGVYTLAYPEIRVSGGKAAEITLTYAEALFDKKHQKGNRNEIEGREILGNYDTFIADGGTGRTFRPLWIRAYRYLELEVHTREAPLEIHDLYGMSTGYPLTMKASFASNDPSLQNIWQVGWRTAQLCAGDLYYDCPYYEQLQYTGDSRIQSLISLYVSGDDRLMRKAITDFYHSRTPEGLTQSHYPANQLQIIPTFSLFWVSMVHDYWMHRRDDAFVRRFLPAIAEVLSWYQTHTDPGSGMLGSMTWWNFVDWDNFNGWGIAPGAEDGHSAIISLQYAATLQQAADLMAAYDKPVQARAYLAAAGKINRATYQLCFDPKKQEIADTPEKKTFSQHAGIWAVLSGALPARQVRPVMRQLLSDTSLGQVTFFYRFYLAQALVKAGMADRYYGSLGPWRKMLALGLTTFAEKPEPARSDCHAWSASPNYDFLATICGIRPASPGFRTLRIEPALGGLQEISASMPHPDGMIRVTFQRHGAHLRGTVSLPGALHGRLLWKNKMIALRGGAQKISI